MLSLFFPSPSPPHDYNRLSLSYKTHKRPHNNKVTTIVADSNKVFAVVVAFCSFLWFKNLKIKLSKIINLIGASTFGVLLIHANSDSMRLWLWKKTVDCVGHYDLSLSSLILFSFAVVFAVFFVCIAIDIVRIKALEKPLFKMFDKKIEKWQARLQAIRY